MRLFLAFLLFAVTAEAQQVGQNGIIFTPPGGGGGLTPGSTPIGSATNCGLYADGTSLLQCSSTEIAYDGTTLSAPKLSIPDGLVGAPSLFLSGDAGSDTGFYRAGANQLNLSINGVQTFQFSSSTLFVLNSGTFSFGGLTYLSSPASGVAMVGESTNIHALRYGLVVTANTGTATPANANSGTTYTNTGDADGSQVTLPNDPTIGVHFTITATAAQNITVAPSAGETVMFGNTVCGTSLVVGGAATGIGDSVTVIAATGGSGAVWITTASAGTPVCTP